jgi:hypothetical protein
VPTVTASASGPPKVQRAQRHLLGTATGRVVGGTLPAVLQPDHMGSDERFLRAHLQKNPPPFLHDCHGAAHLFATHQRLSLRSEEQTAAQDLQELLAEEADEERGEPGDPSEDSVHLRLEKTPR